MASFSEWKKKKKAGQQTAVKDAKEWGPSASKSDMAFSDWVNRKKGTDITPYKSQGTTAAVKPISDITGEAAGHSGSFGGTRAGSFTGSRGSGPFGGGSKYEALPSTKREDEKEELRAEVRQQTQLAKGVSPETLGERAKQQEWTETVESDRREAGQLGAKLRLGEATDQDVTDYLGKIKENYGFVPTTASLEEMLDQTQSYLRTQQPKAATYAQLAAEEKDPLSLLANTAKGAAEQFGGSLAQTVSTGAKYIQPSTVVNLFRGFPARNPLMGRAVDVLLDPAKEKLVEGTQNVADKLKESGTEDIAKAQQGLNPAGRFLVNAGVGLTQMAGDAAIGAATGGGSMIPLLARSFGSGVQEARGKGYSEEEQLALGLTSAATEYFSERLFGGNPVYDEDVGLVNWLVGKVVKSPTVMKVLSSAPAEIGSEGLEELVSGLLNPVWEWVITGNQPEYKLDELIEEGALGVLTALLARGGAAMVGKVTGNRTNAGENLDTQAGERYDGSKETEQGGLKDGRGEEAGRFDTGVGESGRRYDRETLWYQAKKTDAGGGRRSEGDSAFVERVLAEGKTVEGTDQRRYAYRLTAEEDYAPATREAMETAKEWGLAPTVVDGFEWNNGKRTFYGADAVTGSQGQVFLVNGSGKEEIAHEGLHSGLNRGIPEAKKFFELTNQLDLMEETVSKALEKITTTYYDKLGRTFDPKKDMLRLSEEFAAFISGKIETGQAEEFFGLTEEANPEIFASWRDFKAAMGANPMPQTGLEGDGPVSYSLDAFPKKPDPLVNDTTADDILRDRSAVNFLTRRGGLELKSNMTQAEKRQAVKEAVERVARHSEGGNGAMFSALNPGETAEQMKPQGEEPGPSSVFKPGEEGKQQEIFKLLGDYRQPDGKFDVEASKQDYKNFLQDVPEKNRIYLKQALDAVESEVSEDPTTIFLYDGKADRIIYNPKNAIFGKYDIGVAFTHELAHRIDKYFARAAEDTRFVQAIQEAKAVIDADPEMFIRFCKENDREGFCSDILSAICKGEYEFPMEHDTGYWNQSRQAGEIFANLFSMETYQDTEKIEFLRKHFPELIASYEALDFYIH